MLTIISTEISKLKRSLVLLLCVASPSFVAILAVLMFLRWPDPASWVRFTSGGAAMWAFFMLPMTITALTVLVAQLEHGPKAWNHILALPVARWRIHLAKAIVVVGLVGAMSAALALLLPLAGILAEGIEAGDQLTGPVPWAETANLLGRMFAGSILLVAIQLWAALRFRSFVPPLVLGITGTFVAVAATSAKEGPYFPWLIPTNALASDPARAELAIQIGLFGGLVLLGLMVVRMARVEVR